MLKAFDGTIEVRVEMDIMSGEDLLIKVVELLDLYNVDPTLGVLQDNFDRIRKSYERQMENQDEVLIEDADRDFLLGCYIALTKMKSI